MATKPTHRLKVMNKKTNAKCNDAGAAWLNKDGSISIVLGACVVLTEDRDMVYTLFPIDREEP